MKSDVLSHDSRNGCAKVWFVLLSLVTLGNKEDGFEVTSHTGHFIILCRVRNQVKRD